MTYLSGTFHAPPPKPKVCRTNKPPIISTVPNCSLTITPAPDFPCSSPQTGFRIALSASFPNLPMLHNIGLLWLNCSGPGTIPNPGATTFPNCLPLNATIGVQLLDSANNVLGTLFAGVNFSGTL